MYKLLLAGALMALGAPAVAGGDQADNAVPAVVPHCGAGAAPAAGGGAKKSPVMLPGFGTGGFKVRTVSPEAQAWFDYGMKLAHAFNHQPAIDAFAEAGRRDPTCAMCVWGEAWARGPTINFDIEPDAKKRAAELAAKAVVLAEGGPEKERLLAAALVKRYGPALGKGADVAFADAMDGVAARYPTDNEIAVMTADAWMIAHWSDRHAQNHAMDLLTAALKRDPNDTGAIHFYIHVTEAAGVPQYALPFARRLGELAPAAAHLVHMPSHTFIHVGLFQLASDVNAQAMRADKDFLRKGGVGELWKNSYHTHNVSFGLGGAMMAGDGPSALGFAREFEDLAKTADPSKPWLQESSARRFVAYGRWAPAEQVLALPDPGATQVFARAMWRYARGEALSRKGDAAGVLAEARAITLSESDLSSLGAARDDCERLIGVARAVLEGRGAMLQGRWDAAADAFRRGADIQAAHFARGWDPPEWWYPVRRSVAEAELRAGRLDAAEADAKSVLKTWKDDPVSEWVLAGVQTAQGRTAEAEALRVKARGEWRGDVSAIKPTDV